MPTVPPPGSAIHGKCQPPKKRIDQQQAGGDHVRVFAEEKQAELEAAVFGVIAADQFLLGFGQIERQPIALGEDAGQEQQKRQRLIEDVPADAVDLLQSMICSRFSEPVSSTTPRIDMPSGIS